MNREDREEYISRVEGAFRAYVEAFRTYGEKDGASYEELRILHGNLLYSLEREFGPLSFQSTRPSVSLEELSHLENMVIEPVHRQPADGDRE